MNEQSPLISIIIPAYNRAILIKETIHSVKQQTYKNWECVVVDDGSTDGTLEVIEDLAKSDSRIKLIRRNTVKKGAPVCRNIGLANASGNYIIYLDSDDLLAPFCLDARIHCFLEHNNLDFLVFPMLVFKDTPYDLDLIWNVDSEENDLERFLRADALWQTMGPIYKKDVLVELNGFREDLPFWQDLDLHLRLLMLGYKYKKFLQLPPDCFYRGHYNNRATICSPFATGNNMQSQKIEFYFSQIRFLKSRGIALSNNAQSILWSVVCELISGYLFEHSSFKKYISYWCKSVRILKVKRFDQLATLIYQLLVKISKESHYFIKLKTLYHKQFHRHLADDSVLSNNTVAKIIYVDRKNHHVPGLIIDSL